MKKDDTRSLILKAAKKEFAEKGFNGARMSSISEAAGSNQALIHYYFGSKENLYTTVVESLFKFDPHRVPRIFKSPWNLDVPQKLYALLYFMVRININTTDMDAHRIFAWGMAEKNAFLKPLIEKYIHPRMDALRIFIQKGIDEGFFETSNVDFAVISLLSIVHSFAKFRDKSEGTPMHDRIFTETSKDDFVNFFIKSAFKMLTPADKPLLVPSLPGEIIDFMNELISQIMDEENSEFSGELIARITALIQT